MSDNITVIDKYIECFDDCRPILYKGIVITPFTVRDIRLRDYACYCLIIDPVDLNDITLMPLKRLDLIMTVFERFLNNQIPSDKSIAKKFQLIADSFKTLLKSVFIGYNFDFSDPNNPNRKRILRVIDDENQKYQVFGINDFEEISELILYHNGIDVSYRDKYPAGLRKELDEKIEKMNKSKDAPSIEKMIDSAFLFINDYEKILNLPVRKFYNLILNIQKREEYEILMSGAYIVKNVSHWMSGQYEKDPYKDLVTTESQVMGKFKDL